MCVCGHPRSAHHGTGPCLVAVSGITGRDLDAKAKGSPSAPTNSVCACSAYAPKPSAYAEAVSAPPRPFEIDLEAKLEALPDAEREQAHSDLRAFRELVEANPLWAFLPHRGEQEYRETHGIPSPAPRAAARSSSWS
jgi:hypothetical protein